MPTRPRRRALVGTVVAILTMLAALTAPSAVAAPAVAAPAAPVVVTPATAQGAPFAVMVTATTGDCPSNTFCIYQLTNYGGRNGYGAGFPAPGTAGLPAHTYKKCNFDGLSYPSGTPIDNTASSMVNNTRFYVVLWQLRGCTGTKYVARPHTVDTTFVNNGFDNKASAIEFVDDRT